jgi:hypothetical protein
MPTTASRTTSAPSATKTITPERFFFGYTSRSSRSLDGEIIGAATGAVRACEGTVIAIGFRGAGAGAGGGGAGACASGAITTAGVLGPSFGVYAMA